MAEPCRVGGPMRRGSRPTRRGGRIFDLFRAKRGCLASAMARWKPNATWRSSNTTWWAAFCPFSSQKRVSCLSHVALEAQCDVAHLQHDIAGLFSPFSRLKGSFLPQPCRVGGPMRRGACPTRRGAGVFSPFSELKEGVLPQPCRVGAPTRRGATPTQRGGSPTHP